MSTGGYHTKATNTRTVRVQYRIVLEFWSEYRYEHQAHIDLQFAYEYRHYSTIFRTYSTEHNILVTLGGGWDW